ATFAGSTDYNSAANSATFSITSSNNPELQVANLAISPTSPVSGAQATVSWNDLNIGDDLTSSFIDHVLVVNQTTGQTLVNSDVPYDATPPGAAILAGHSSAQRHLTFTLADGDPGAGTLQVTVTTDFNHLFLTPPSGHAVTISATANLGDYPD